MKKVLLASLMSVFCVVGNVWAEDEERPVYITPGLPYVDVEGEKGTVRIERNQDTENMLDFDYGMTSRPCPPFCVQPMKLAPGVETIGELELLEYLKRVSAGDDSVLVIDSREKSWVQRGMIPGAVNIPWTRMSPEYGDYEDIAEVMDLEFDAVQEYGLWNFNSVRTLVMYCNGPWCGQSPTNIRTLLSYGYPAAKIKWYRGGMQSWRSLGFNVIDPGD